VRCRFVIRDAGAQMPRSTYIARISSKEIAAMFGF
jgi:hypothetical protein